MSVTDPIADALTIIRNASSAKKENAEIKASKIIGQILEILKKERFLQDFRFIEDKKQGTYKVYLKYHKKSIPAITGIRRGSLSGRRTYLKKDKIKKVCGGLGISILSTSRGLLRDEDARVLGVGGEILCEVW